MVNLFHTSNPSFPILIFRAILFLNPSYHFCNAYNFITNISGSRFSYDDSVWTNGSPFTWNEFTKRFRATRLNISVIRPSGLESLGYMWIDIIIFVLLTFLFDNMVASNRGFSRNPFKLLLRLVSWGTGKVNSLKLGKKGEILRRASDASFLSDDLSVSLADSSRSSYMHDLSEMHAKGISTGVSLNKISKVYNKAGCFLKKGNERWALKEISMELGKGELFGLLGPNGAGKTTLIG